MIFYLALYFVPLILAINQKYLKKEFNNNLFIFFLLVLFFLIAFRNQVGGDWRGYVIISQQYRSFDLFDFDFKRNNIGIFLINKFFSYLSLDHYGINIFSSALFISSIYIFLRKEKYLWLSICILLPVIVIVLIMGFVKQGIAFSFLLIAINYWKQNKMLHYLFFILVGVLFHKSLLPFALLFLVPPNGMPKINLFNIIAVIFMITVFLYFDIYEKLLYYTINSGEVNFDSRGATLRLLINLIPAFIFIFFYKFFLYFNYFRLILIFSIVSIILIFFVTDYSTLVDRFIMYLSVLQLLVFTKVPEIMKDNRLNTFIYFLILMFYLIILLVWLIYSNNSIFWMPYNIII